MLPADFTGTPFYDCRVIGVKTKMRQQREVVATIIAHRGIEASLCGSKRMPFSVVVPVICVVVCTLLTSTDAQASVSLCLQVRFVALLATLMALFSLTGLTGLLKLTGLVGHLRELAIQTAKGV